MRKICYKTSKKRKNWKRLKNKSLNRRSCNKKPWEMYNWRSLKRREKKTTFNKELRKLILWTNWNKKLMKKDKVLLKRKGRKERFARRLFMKMKYISSNSWCRRKKRSKKKLDWGKNMRNILNSKIKKDKKNGIREKLEFKA